MLIRSQDKILSVSYEAGLWAVNRSDIRFLNLYNTDKWMLFGRYENQDKAIKVLDMMQMAFFRAEKMKMIYSHSGHLSNSCIQDFTFQMPQDAEVDSNMTNGDKIRIMSDE